MRPCVHLDGTWTIQGDPTEGALLVAAHKLGLHEEDLKGRFSRWGEVPFSSERKLMSTVHEDHAREEDLLIFSKGAPDVLLARCEYEQVGGSEQPKHLSSERRAAILVEVGTGRSLGVAHTWRGFARDAAWRDR